MITAAPPPNSTNLGNSESGDIRVPSKWVSMGLNNFFDVVNSVARNGRPKADALLASLGPKERNEWCPVLELIVAGVDRATELEADPCHGLRDTLFSATPTIEMQVAINAFDVRQHTQNFCMKIFDSYYVGTFQAQTQYDDSIEMMASVTGVYPSQIAAFSCGLEISTRYPRDGFTVLRSFPKSASDDIRKDKSPCNFDEYSIQLVEALRQTPYQSGHAFLTAARTYGVVKVTTDFLDGAAVGARNYLDRNSEPWGIKEEDVVPLLAGLERFERSRKLQMSSLQELRLVD